MITFTRSPGRLMIATWVTRWSAYGLMTLSLAAAAGLRAGIFPHLWQWSALGLSLAALLSWAARSRSRLILTQADRWGSRILVFLVAWMLLQIVPLPPTVVNWLSPHRWDAAAAARAIAGASPAAWLALSLAPALTMQYLLNFVPDMAAFVAAQYMTEWWRDRKWIVVAPVVVVACLESVLSLAQFYAMRATGGNARPSGTYDNPDHFAALAGIAFPVAVMWSVSEFRGTASPHGRDGGSGLRAAAILGMGACMLAGVVVSLSRMVFASTLAAIGFTALLLLIPRNPKASLASRVWRWSVPIALPLCLLIFLPTPELLNRFANDSIAGDGRIAIWKDSVKVIEAYKWTGTGLGAYERGQYLYKTSMPTHAVGYAHNDYLQIFAELGFVGFALMGALAGWLLWRTCSIALGKPGGGDWELAVGLLAALFALAIDSLVDFNLYVPANALAIAWLAGVAASPQLGKSYHRTG